MPCAIRLLLSYRDKLLSPRRPQLSMNRLAGLLGSVTRANIVEALALSPRPLTAYRMARVYDMNVAKVYAEVKRLRRLGVLGLARKEAGQEYVLADGDLRSLALRMASRVQTYESWRSPESRRRRFRAGLSLVPPLPVGPPVEPEYAVPRRMEGELDNLAALGRRKFDSRYRRTGEREYALI